MSALNPIPLTPLMTIAVHVGNAITIDPGSPGRRFIPITGGEVLGTLTGRVLAGGGDWQNLAMDGTLEISAHYILDLDGHGLVEVQSDGVRHAGPDILAALARGEDVDPSLYYFRTVIRLRGCSPAAGRLGNILCLARGRRAPSMVHLEVFEVG